MGREFFHVWLAFLLVSFIVILNTCDDKDQTEMIRTLTRIDGKQTELIDSLHGRIETLEQAQ